MTESEMDEIKKSILRAALKEYPQEFPSKRWVEIEVEPGEGHKYSDARKDLEEEGLIEVRAKTYTSFGACLTEQGKDFCDKRRWSQ